MVAFRKTFHCPDCNEVLDELEDVTPPTLLRCEVCNRTWFYKHGMEIVRRIKHYDDVVSFDFTQAPHDDPDWTEYMEDLRRYEKAERFAQMDEEEEEF